MSYVLILIIMVLIEAPWWLFVLWGIALVVRIALTVLYLVLKNG